MDPSPGPLTVIERAPGRFTIAGELDMATGPQLEELEDVHGPLLLDLHDVTFIDANGISALIELSQRCPHHGCTFLIEACSTPVERVLRIVGLYDIFTEDGSRDHNGHGPHADLRPPAPALEPEAAAHA
jgi:anti-anti-sigma factor